jgi:dolichol-phosphate mannosyltransferase
MRIEHPEVEILLPVHNEADSIESTVQKVYGELGSRIRIQFIVCEDGSCDNTQEVLERLSSSLPMKLIMSRDRKGYSRAVKDGMKELEADYLLCLDSDGQCDPKDFWPFWDAREDCDVVLGWRIDRADNWMRKGMSRVFYYVYQAFYHTPVHDPSCPYVLAKKPVVQRLWNELGEMQEGFWWEFVARVHRRGYRIRELPVHHRERSAGKTQVYKLRKLPGIGYHHFMALFKIWAQTRKRLPPIADTLS